MSCTGCEYCHCSQRPWFKSQLCRSSQMSLSPSFLVHQRITRVLNYPEFWGKTDGTGELRSTSKLWAGTREDMRNGTAHGVRSGWNGLAPVGRSYQPRPEEQGSELPWDITTPGTTAACSCSRNCRGSQGTGAPPQVKEHSHWQLTARRAGAKRTNTLSWLLTCHWLSCILEDKEANCCTFTATNKVEKERQSPS